MEILNHSLPQITPEVLEKLTPNELLKLSVKLLNDLKELHDRLNQNSTNSSRPSSSIRPWAKDSNSNDGVDELAEDEGEELENSQSEEKNKKADENEPDNEKNVNSELNSNEVLGELTLQNGNSDNLARKKVGKQVGAPGDGRTWNPKATEKTIDCALETCIVCNDSLKPVNNEAYTRYNQVDIQLGNLLQPGLIVTVTPYILYDNT